MSPATATLAVAATLALASGCAATGGGQRTERATLVTDSDRTDTSTVVTANIGRDYTDTPAGTAAVEQAISAVARIAHDGAIVGWQELDESDTAREHAILADALPGAQYAGQNRQHPITVHIANGTGGAWQITSQRRILAVPGGPEGTWADRYVIAAAMRHAGHATGTGRRQVVLNTHMVPGAWNGVANRYESLRRQAWTDHYNLLAELVGYYHRRGFDALVIGDLNAETLPERPIHHTQHVVAHRGVDWILAYPARGHELTVEQVGSVPLGIDEHHALWARLTWAVPAVSTTGAAS